MNNKVAKLIAIGLMIVLILFSFWGMYKKDNNEDFNESPVKQNEQDELENSEENISNNGIDEEVDQENEVKEKDDENIKYDMKDNSDGSAEFIQEEEDLLILNSKKFGEKNINEALKMTEDAVVMWMEEIEDYKSWEKISTKKFLKYTKENIIDKHEERKIIVNEIKTYPLYDQREDVMVVEAIVDYYYEDSSVNEKTMVLITFEMIDKEFLITSLAVM